MENKPLNFVKCISQIYVNYGSLALFIACKIKISFNTDQIDVPKEIYDFRIDTFVIIVA